ncbi:ATP-binding protein [sulfur-oxidizing endosymbiont of Gigantopelta aegis]|uniref:ATP-binding protein n=1 Tax=sulfur-oxidizing endosymbiont of Gigantopelta aegis TaxID=2794934 RepID=UPI0018DB7CEA|nr:SbcC/MukB-like Walker B domain-containing protein [sulfur-oxidizing endosymbiont of Gigantopelta aegis]
MFVKKVIFINWGNVPLLDFDFGPINLFSGGNGSGKTTAADGIQTIMTAAHENLYNYNPGQDETTQRGRRGKQVRTLASYVLGCDDGSYSRPWNTDGYLAAVFHPTQGESAEPFTAVMGIRAHVEQSGKQKQARQDELSFFILQGEMLEQADFIQQEKHIIPLTEIESQLKKKYGTKTVEYYSKKRPYLRRLYAVLRGKHDAVSDREAMHAAKTFSSFMAYKPVKSINDFVAREILENKDMGDAIHDISESMKTIHGMEQDARFIITSIDLLDQTGQFCHSYIEHWVDLIVNHYTEAKRQSLVNQASYLKAKKEQQQINANIIEHEKKIIITEDRLNQAHQERVSLEAQRQGIKALKDKDELLATIEQHNNQLSEQSRPLLEQNFLLSKNTENSVALLDAMKKSSLGVDLPGFDSKDLLAQVRKVVALKEKSEIDLHSLLGSDWVDISPLENHLDNALIAEQEHNRLVALLHDKELQSKNGSNMAISLRDQLQQLLTRQENLLQQTQHKMQQKQQEIDTLHAHKITYPHYVQAALIAIEQQCPQADPRVLCDYIEVLDAEWQMAIEGYLGGARFSILVAEDYEAEAIRVVRNMPGGNRNRARVIQGSRAKRDMKRLDVKTDSIASIMKFEHKTAEYYLKASYGNVLMVSDAEALRSTARGITPDGLASGSYSMWRCDLPDAELVFGQGARERALLAKQEELRIQQDDANKLHRAQQNNRQIFSLLEPIKHLNYVSIITTMLDHHRRLKQAETALSNLDLSSFNSLEQELELCKSSFDELNQQGKTLLKDLGGLQVELKKQKEKVKTLDDAQDQLEQALEHQEEQLQKIASVHNEFNTEETLDLADERARLAGKEMDFLTELDAMREKLGKTTVSIEQSVMQHNQHCKNYDAIAYDSDTYALHSHEFFKRINQLLGEVDSIKNRLKNNVLAEKQEKLTSLKEDFNTAFVTNLCHSIYQAINDGKRILDDLNTELAHHRFGTDQESFRFAYSWVPEFREYQRFFKEVIQQPNLGDGTTLFNAELSENAQKIRDKLMTMLLDDDEQKATRELERISDYRNYRQYEIYKEPMGKQPIPLSQYGTGSGGQLETPAYIIRSAAITSAFRFNEGNSHLRMVMVDEAFSKMDESRSREVINYLTNTLGLQLIFIMPTSKSGPFMDLISNQFVFSKCPTTKARGELQTRMLVDRKICDQDKLKELWANHRKTIRHQAMLDFMEDI